MKFKLLKQLMFFGIMLCSSVILAQTITGTVTSNDGPLPGVSIVVKGTTQGTETDFDGKYSINNVPSDAVLVFSFVGYTTKEVSVGGQSTIDVKLEEDAQALDEIVIIGYGTTTVKDATGAVASVNSEDFNGGVISSPEQLIQGKTAGVQISQTSGEPGAGISINIRGTNSVRSNNNPLFVVDGIPLSGGSTSAGLGVQGLGGNPAKNPLNFLNPNDIESISILKDASATAIYGSRGANGVVIITTKSGRKGKGVFEYTSNLSISSPTKTYDLLSSQEFLSERQRLIPNVTSPDSQDFGASTNWQNVIFRGAASHNQNLSYSKNYGKGSYRATFGYSDQYGIVEKSNLERITGRINASHKFLDDKLKLEFQGTISRVNDATPPIAATTGFAGDLIGSAYAANPTWPNDPDFNPIGTGFNTPANLLAYTQNETKTNRYLLSLAATYNFTKELSAKISGGYDDSQSDNRAVSSSNVNIQGSGITGNGRGAYNDFQFTNSLLEATLNYKKDFGNSKLDAVAGYSYQKFDRNGILASAWGFPSSSLNRMGEDIRSSVELVSSQISGDYQQFGYAPVLSGNASSQTFVNRLTTGSLEPDFINASRGAVTSLFVDTFDNFDELQSYFARVNYTINDKYLFTATIRADGSTSFGENNKYGYFPSGAIAWKINEEDFIGDNVSTLKLRLNVGITGNQEGLGYGNALRRTRYNGTGISNDGSMTVPGTGFVAFLNEDLKWENTLQYGAGLDFGFSNDRLSGSVDVYRKETNDLLFNTPAAQPATQPFQFQNLPDSKVVNQGVEFAIGYDFIESDDLTWNVNFNVAYNDNMVESLSGEYVAGAINGQGLTGAFSQRLKEGFPFFSWHMLEFQGFDSAGLPTHTSGFNDFIGKSALPTVTGGLSTSVSYKNLTMNAYFNGQFGHYVYNATKNAFFTAGSFNSSRNVLGETLTSGESLAASAPVSSRFLEKGDFIRMQNLSFSYNMPLSGEGTFKSLVFSVTGQNLFVITDYSGLDPEVSSATDNGLPSRGIDYGAFPNPRTFTFGVNAKF